MQAGMRSGAQIVGIFMKKAKSKAKKCVYCGLDPRKCKDRVDMINVDTGEVIQRNMMIVWGSGFKISQEVQDA